MGLSGPVVGANTDTSCLQNAAMPCAKVKTCEFRRSLWAPSWRVSVLGQGSRAARSRFRSAAWPAPAAPVALRREIGTRQNEGAMPERRRGGRLVFRARYPIRRTDVDKVFICQPPHLTLVRRGCSVMENSNHLFWTGETGGGFETRLGRITLNRLQE